MRHLVGRAVIACTIAAAAIAPVAADNSQPWANGVSEQQKAAAQKKLEEGNALFLDHKYKEALDSYNAAIATWDHPAIRFNVVRCLIQLERPVEAFDNLTLALKYGAAPLDEAVYNEALSYQKLLGKQISDLEVTCTQAGVKVSLDGQPLATCPATEKRRIAPGHHQLVGVKDHFQTITKDVVALGGEQQRAEVSLVPLEKAARLTRRWASWKPWVVFGGGLGVAGIGGLLQLKASSDMATFDRNVTLTCAGMGCANVDRGLENTAKLENRFAIGFIVTGAAAAATGAVLLYMNRTHTEYPQVDVAPTQGGASVSVRGSF